MPTAARSWKRAARTHIANLYRQMTRRGFARGRGSVGVLVSGLRAHQPGTTARILHEAIDIPPIRTSFNAGSRESWSLAHRFEALESAATETAGIITVDSARISMPTSMHRRRDGAIFEEALLGRYVLANPKYVAQRYLLMAPTRMRLDEGVLLSLPWCHNYYHWMIEMLPRLCLVDAQPALADLPLLIPAAAPAFVAESLALAGYASRARALRNGRYTVGRLHIPTRLARTSNVSPLAINWLTENLAPRPLNRGRGSRLYISREDAPSRYVVNEDEVAQLLSGYGFTKVVMKGLPLAQQLELFAGAEFVVGSHGAAFANLAFSPSGSRFIEFFEEGYDNSCFARMAAVRGLHYGLLVCPRVGHGIDVDLSELDAVVSQALERTGAQ